jgi:hypothetical protein
MDTGGQHWPILAARLLRGDSLASGAAATASRDWESNAPPLGGSGKRRAAPGEDRREEECPTAPNGTRGDGAGTSRQPSPGGWRCVVASRAPTATSYASQSALSVLVTSTYSSSAAVRGPALFSRGTFSASRDDEVEQWLKNLPAVWNKATTEERNQMLHLAMVRVDVVGTGRPKALEIKWAGWTA